MLGRGSRRLLSAGRAIRSALERVDSKVAAPAIARFAAAQGALESAQLRVDAFDVQLGAATTSRRKAKAAQRQLLEQVAAELVSDGFSRVHPFAELSTFAVWSLAVMKVVEAESAISALVVKLEAHARVGARTKATGRRLLDATGELVSIDANCQGLRVEKAHALDAREAFAPAWRAAEATLRVALRFADSQEQTCHFEKVFRPRIRARRTPEPLSLAVADA